MKSFLGMLVMTVVTVLVIVGFVFLLNGANLAAWSFFGPKVVQVQRDITENSKSFIDSTNMAASNAITEYYELNTMRVAANEADKKVMAESYAQQMRALARSVCDTIAPLAPQDYSQTVTGFVSAIGGCVSAGQ